MPNSYGFSTLHRVVNIAKIDCTSRIFPKFKRTTKDPLDIRNGGGCGGYRGCGGVTVVAKLSYGGCDICKYAKCKAQPSDRRGSTPNFYIASFLSKVHDASPQHRPYQSDIVC